MCLPSDHRKCVLVSVRMGRSTEGRKKHIRTILRETRTPRTMGAEAFAYFHTRFFVAAVALHLCRFIILTSKDSVTYQAVGRNLHAGCGRPQFAPSFTFTQWLTVCFSTLFSIHMYKCVCVYYPPFSSNHLPLCVCVSVVGVGVTHISI